MVQSSNQMLEVLMRSLEELNIDCSDVQLQKMQQYYELLMNANQRINFTRIVDPQEVAVKHFADSLTLLRHQLLPGDCRLVDVGSGAGFPGVPLAILRPDIHFVLLDSLRKRTDFLQNAIEFLQLTNVRIVWARAEDAARMVNFREKFDVAVARAVAALPVLTEYCLPFVRVGGIFVAMKGPLGTIEVKQAEAAIRSLGGNIESVYPLSLPVLPDERQLIVIKKVTPTNRQFPRKAGIPEKQPLQ